MAKKRKRFFVFPILRASIAVWVAGLMLIGVPPSVQAKKPLPKIGTVVDFQSANKKYTIQTKWLGHPDKSPCECTFKEDGKIKWTKQLPSTPGLVEISEDGRYFAFVNYRNYDENWFRGVSFFTDDGTLLKEVSFVKEKRHVRKVLLRNDLAFVATFGHGAAIFLSAFQLPAATPAWEKKIGSGQLYDLQASAGGEILLAAIYDYDLTNVAYLLLDATGMQHWRGDFKDRGSLEGGGWPMVLKLEGSGSRFSVFEPLSGKWLAFGYQAGAVTEVQE